MPFTPVSVRNFDRVLKKLPRSMQGEVDRQVRRICRDPWIGEPKRSDLSGVHVHKVRLAGQLQLLAYWVDEGERRSTLLALGGHENFFRDLKQYLKSQSGGVRV